MSLTTRIRASITKMLQVQNDTTNQYIWLSEYTPDQLRKMMTGWQVNQPALFNKHGIYVM